MSARRFLPLAATLCALAFPAAAQGALGDLIGQSCVSKTGTDGCVALPEPSLLDSAGSLVMAPDGSDVYVGAGAGVTHFRRAPDGSLTYANCVDTSTSPASTRCPGVAPAEAGGALSLNAINLAISPDGRHVYAVSWVDSLLWWVRDPGTGDLTWGGCRDAATDSATTATAVPRPPSQAATSRPGRWPSPRASR